MRPALIFISFIVTLLVLDGVLYIHSSYRQAKDITYIPANNIVTSVLGLTDLCVSTEARYTRHPSLSDPVAPFMDHPGCLEHFPTGSFWSPPPGYLGKRL